MALDGVPWFIGGDAEHGPEVARTLAYLATGGKQGVAGPLDLKVVPLDVPGGGVKVLSGVASILNRVQARQAYTVRNAATDPDSVKIPATGSSGGRSDLVICRVDNSNIDDPSKAPADLVHGPYDKFDVVPGVPAGTRRLKDLPQYAGLSAIELARIDLGASSGTVGAAQIVDLRRIANAKTETSNFAGSLPSPVQTETLSGSWAAFPKTGIQNVEIPDWATHLSMEWKTTYSAISGNDYFFLQAYFGDGSLGQIASQTIDGQGAGKYRSPLMLPTQGDWPIPESIRGTTQAITSRIRAAGDGGGKVATTSSDYFYATITFKEKIA